MSKRILDHPFPHVFGDGGGCAVMFWMYDYVNVLSEIHDAFTWLETCATVEKTNDAFMSLCSATSESELKLPLPPQGAFVTMPLLREVPTLVALDVIFLYSFLLFRRIEVVCPCCSVLSERPESVSSNCVKSLR